MYAKFFISDRIKYLQTVANFRNIDGDASFSVNPSYRRFVNNYMYATLCNNTQLKLDAAFICRHKIKLHSPLLQVIFINLPVHRMHMV